LFFFDGKSKIGNWYVEIVENIVYDGKPVIVYQYVILLYN
jgi:hypothetical protein